MECRDNCRAFLSPVMQCVSPLTDGDDGCDNWMPNSSALEYHGAVRAAYSHFVSILKISVSAVIAVINPAFPAPLG